MKPLVTPAWIAAVAALVVGLALPSSAQDEDYSKLLASLRATKLTLADGLASVRPPAVPISAKFELGDNPGHTLSLSVYVAERGVNVGATHNRLDELLGDPTTSPWKPSTSPLVGVDLNEGLGQLTVAAQSRVSLLDIYKRAKADSGGTIISITATAFRGEHVFAVRAARSGTVSELLYNLKGTLVGQRGDDALQ
jgi:hypothetical protein